MAAPAQPKNGRHNFREKNFPSMTQKHGGILRNAAGVSRYCDPPGKEEKKKRAEPPTKKGAVG